MHTLLAARGTRLLVASPPNSATIYADQLPLWARNRGQRTEYDVFLDDLAARGVPAIDLRPALIAAKAEGKVYRMNDTHWTALGAVAAFNAIVQADSHPDWKLDPARVLGAPETIVGGDLARLLGTADNMKETDRLSALPPGKREALDKVKENTAALATSDRSGPTIMIIGDLFTGDFFLSMLLQDTGRVVWLHHSFCGFDWKWIDQLRPDEVWWMPDRTLHRLRKRRRPAARYAPLGPGRRALRARSINRIELSARVQPSSEQSPATSHRTRCRHHARSRPEKRWRLRS